ncbi:MAG: hypothetical protein ACK5NF_04550 [Bacilli bacterium]
MKTYIPFFIISIFIIFVIYMNYNPANDFVIEENLYKYNNNSYQKIQELEIELDRYYEYIDCNILKDDFDVNNIGIYKKIRNCDVNLDKINHLTKYYSIDDIIKMVEIEFDYKLINKSNNRKFRKLFGDEYFIESRTERYLDYKGEDAILNVNLDYDLSAYDNYNTIYEVNELSIVNKYNKLNSANRNWTYCYGFSVYNNKMCNDLEKFFDELDSFNIKYTIVKTLDKGDLYDEHATGLAIDLDYKEEHDSTIEKIGSKYGFILRFKKEYSAIFKYEERGHFRYVGEKSNEIYKLQISLDEYNYISRN